jgi:hypothetical protein
MDIIHYFALDQLVRERRRNRRKVYVIADMNGTRREGKIIREREGRWLVEFFPVELDGLVERTMRCYLSLREFEIHPVDKTQFQEHVDALFDAYSDLDLDV